MLDQSTLITEIEDYCRRTDVTESAFGDQAVNDGGFVGRLRDGAQMQIATLSKVRAFIAVQRPQSETQNPPNPLIAENSPNKTSPNPTQSRSEFRFYDNRQKYLMFVNTCGEKLRVAQRAGLELTHIHPKPPALRLFDAGVGDGTVLTSVMRQLHQRFRNMPFYIVGKEISLEDVRLCLDKMPDRFHEHPATVLVMTNLYYAEAPWLAPSSMQAAATLNWVDVPLGGDSSHEFHQQIDELQPQLADTWQVHSSPKTGNPLYTRPSVLVLYREDQKFLLDQILPKPGQCGADYDLVLASQPYRARTPVEFKIKKVLAPLAKSLAPGGRMLGIHSYGGDPGLEIIRKVWPGEQPFTTDRHVLLKGLKAQLGRTHRDLSFNPGPDSRAIFRYNKHTLPTEVSGKSIGTSTLMAAWNAASYVAQIEDERLEEVITNGAYLEATREVLNQYGELWFLDESYVVSRKRA